MTSVRCDFYSLSLSVVVRSSRFLVMFYCSFCLFVMICSLSLSLVVKVKSFSPDVLLSFSCDFCSLWFLFVEFGYCCC